MDNDVSGLPEREALHVPVLAVPEIRDYQRVNAELFQLLEQGHRRVRLAGVERQRLLVAGLSGPWQAVVEIEGFAGPEVAAGLDAPELTVVVRGDTADGAASGMRSGRVVIVGNTGAAAGYALHGGTLVVYGDAGPRGGLNQSGGVILIGGAVGQLAGERQSGGVLFALGADAWRSRKSRSPRRAFGVVGTDLSTQRTRRGSPTSVCRSIFSFTGRVSTHRPRFFHRLIVPHCHRTNPSGPPRCSMIRVGS